MTAERRRQLLMGGGAGAVLVLGMWLMWPASPAPSAASATAPRARQSRAARDAAVDVLPVSPVKLGSLQDARQEPSEAPRNPFRFQPKVAPPPPRPVSVPTTPVNAPPPRPAPPAGPPPAPPIPLKFIGVLTRENGVKWAVLTDGKAPPFHGRDGDPIDGRYRIVKIGEESIEMTYIDGRGRQVIRLTGQ